MDALPLIPIPPSKRWWQFRKQVLPVLVFCATLLGVRYHWQQVIISPERTGAPAGEFATTPPSQTNSVEQLPKKDNRIAALL